MNITAICDTCRQFHPIDFDPAVGPGAAFGDWLTKHPDAAHRTRFEWPGRSAKAEQAPAGWEGYLHNSNVKVAYAASANNTITLASLASDTNRLTGQEGTAVDNTTNLYLDYLLTGKVTQGTSPTAGQIDVSVVGMLDDSTWPDVFDGTNSAESVSTQNVFNAVCRIAASMVTDTASNGVNYFGPVSVASFFGGAVPLQFVPFVAHNTVAALNATAGNQQITTKGVYATVV